MAITWFYVSQVDKEGCVGAGTSHAVVRTSTAYHPALHKSSVTEDGMHTNTPNESAQW